MDDVDCLVLTDTTSGDDRDRSYAETENQEKVMVLSLVRALQDLVTATGTTNPQHLARCNEICSAVIAFAFKNRREPLEPMTAMSTSRPRGASGNHFRGSFSAMQSNDAHKA
jgi:hypothetical protein